MARTTSPVDPEAPALPQRTCVACGQTDTDPRHDIVIQLAPDLLVASFHLDCHALMDPPCESCAAQTAGAAGATGDAMRAVIMANASQGAD